MGVSKKYQIIVIGFVGRGITVGFASLGDLPPFFKPTTFFEVS